MNVSGTEGQSTSDCVVNPRSGSAPTEAQLADFLQRQTKHRTESAEAFQQDATSEPSMRELLEEQVKLQRQVRGVKNHVIRVQQGLLICQFLNVLIAGALVAIAVFLYLRSGNSNPIAGVSEPQANWGQENKKLKKSGPVAAKQEVISSEELSIDDWTLVIEQLKLEDNKELRGLVDQKKSKLSKGCVVLLSEANEKVAIVAGVTKNLVDTISAKDVVSELCAQLDGRGGGRPDFAQGAGNSKNINDFVTSIPKTVKSLSK